MSSETLTWLRENYRETPAAAKPQLDRLFVAGINHIFYHGVTYSPSDAPWPGWFFYAATQLGPDNPLWPHFTAMNGYVTRVQSILQAGRPDNDVLLYWPFDELADRGSGLMNQYGVHEIAWLMETSFAEVAQRLLSAGYAFDFISDAQLAGLRVEKGQLVAPGGSYRLIVVPAVQRMAPDTLARLAELQRRGATLVFEKLPEDVPGFSRLEARRSELAKGLADPALRAAVATQGLEARLAQLAVRREAAGPAGLGFIRRAQPQGYDYFFTNLTAKGFDGWLDLGVTATGAMLLDPMTGEAGLAALKKTELGTARVYLQLDSGQSLILRTANSWRVGRDVVGWRYVRPLSAGIPLEGEWRVEFIKGGPALPGAATLRELRSWTTLEAEAERFAGTARYRLEFDAPATRAEAWTLELGDVREAAQVSLNGKPLGAAWAAPFTLRVDGLKPRGNVLEIEVSNLPANRIRDLDVRQVDWKIMKDINLVSLSYAKFDAAGWEIAPSGLLGPVRLRPLEIVRPR